MLPLQVEGGKLLPASDTRTAVNAFIELLLTTPCHSCVADPDFGFIFNNLRFEIFNEKEGVIYNAAEKEDTQSGLYDKKVSGTSKSINTFAVELKNAIEQYEKRLSDVSVTMAYVKNLKKIHVNVEGVLVEDNTAYQYTTSINVWN